MSDETQTKTDQDPYRMTGELIHALSKDPKFRPRILSLIKEAAPDTVIPELDMQSTLLKSVEDRIKPKEEELKATSDRLSNLERSLYREKFRISHNLSDAELVEVETLAKDNQIGKGEVALELWKGRRAAEVRGGSRRPEPASAAYFSKLAKVSPTETKTIKNLALEEATRILHEGA